MRIKDGYCKIQVRRKWKIAGVRIQKRLDIYSPISQLFKNVRKPKYSVIKYVKDSNKKKTSERLDFFT